MNEFLYNLNLKGIVKDLLFINRNELIQLLHVILHSIKDD
jgi:hypothetical protein